MSYLSIPAPLHTQVGTEFLIGSGDNLSAITAHRGSHITSLSSIVLNCKVGIVITPASLEEHMRWYVRGLSIDEDDEEVL